MAQSWPDALPALAKEVHTFVSEEGRQHLVAEPCGLLESDLNALRLEEPHGFGHEFATWLLETAAVTEPSSNAVNTNSQMRPLFQTGIAYKLRRRVRFAESHPVVVSASTRLLNLEAAARAGFHIGTHILALDQANDACLAERRNMPFDFDESALGKAIAALRSRFPKVSTVSAELLVRRAFLKLKAKINEATALPLDLGLALVGKPPEQGQEALMPEDLVLGVSDLAGMLDQSSERFQELRRGYLAQIGALLAQRPGSPAS